MYLSCCLNKNSRKKKKEKVLTDKPVFGFYFLRRCFGKILPHLKISNTRAVSAKNLVQFPLICFKQGDVINVNIFID